MRKKRCAIWRAQLAAKHDLFGDYVPRDALEASWAALTASLFLTPLLLPGNEGASPRQQALAAIPSVASRGVV